MKANAPEKLYLNWTEYPLEEIQVEYTRTDAFIEKTEKYLKSQFIKDVSVSFGGTVHINFSTAFENFLNYMKGE